MTLLQTLIPNGFIETAARNLRLVESLAAAQAENLELQKLLGCMVWYALAMTLLVFYLWGKYTALKAARMEPKTVHLNIGRMAAPALPVPFDKAFEESMKSQVLAEMNKPAQFM